MEIITIDSVAFKILVEKIDQISTYIKKTEPIKETPSEELLTNGKICSILSISSSTLYRLRRDGEINYSIVKGKCRYTKNDIEEYMERCKIIVGNTTLEDMKSNYNIRKKGGSNGK